jgi:anti-sigma-K factor RskA
VQDIAVPTDLQGVAAFAVTEEPAGGSPQPTMTPFLVGAVPKS